MRYAILGDIHGNLEALEAVIASARSFGVRKFFCIGDIVGYNANPKECINKIKEIKALSVAGNHDWAAIGKMPLDNLNDWAKAAIKWTKDNLDSDHIKFLESLNLVERTEQFILVHSSLFKPEKFDYIKDSTQCLDTFYCMDRNLCFIGHTHVAQAFVAKENKMQFVDAKTFCLEDKCKYIVNVGSVGQPRDYNPQACYCIYDPDLDRIEIKRASYDIPKAQSKIYSAGLPEFLAKRIAVGE